MGIQLRRRIDYKHHAEIVNVLEADALQQGRRVAIVKTTNGQEVPDEEPMALFRGRDHLAIPLLQAYKELCIGDGCNDFQLDTINKLLQDFRDFAAQYPERMKQPGVTRGK